MTGRGQVDDWRPRPGSGRSWRRGRPTTRPLQGRRSLAVRSSCQAARRADTAHAMRARCWAAQREWRRGAALSVAQLCLPAESSSARVGLGRRNVMPSLSVGAAHTDGRVPVPVPVPSDAPGEKSSSRNAALDSTALRCIATSHPATPSSHFPLPTSVVSASQRPFPAVSPPPRPVLRQLPDGHPNGELSPASSSREASPPCVRLLRQHLPPRRVARLEPRLAVPATDPRPSRSTHGRKPRQTCPTTRSAARTPQRVRRCASSHSVRLQLGVGNGGR